MSKLIKTESEIAILKLELKKLDVDLEIAHEKYAYELISENRFNYTVDYIIKAQIKIKRRINAKKHQIENPHMYVWSDNEAYNKEGNRVAF